MSQYCTIILLVMGAVLTGSILWIAIQMKSWVRIMAELEVWMKEDALRKDA